MNVENAKNDSVQSSTDSSSSTRQPRSRRMPEWVKSFVAGCSVTAVFAFALFEKPGIIQIEDKPEQDPIIRLAAGCLIKLESDSEQVMLGVLHKQEGRIVFSPPGGFVDEPDNSDMRLAAEREVEEETGFAARAGELVEKFSRTGVNFHLFACELTSPFPKRDPDYNEVLGVAFLPPSRMGDNAWRYPRQGIVIREKFKALKMSEIAPFNFGKENIGELQEQGRPSQSTSTGTAAEPDGSSRTADAAAQP